MRHLIGIVLALVMAGVLFFAATWGYVRTGALAAHPSLVPGGGVSLLTDRSALAPLIAVAGTGLLAGILIGVPRISPFATGLPGLALLALTALYLTSVHRGIDLIPLRSHVFGAGLEAMLAKGILGGAGLAMIIPIFVPSRWRARRKAAAPAADEASEFVSPLKETTQAHLQVRTEAQTQTQAQAPARAPESAGPAGYPEPLTQARTAAYRPAPAHHAGPSAAAARRPYPG